MYATSGKLRYRVSFPEEVIKAEIRFSGFLSTETWEAETVNLLSGSVNSGGSRLAQGTVNLYSGYYRISLELSMIRDGIYQRVFKTKIVKIMSSLPSELDETFTVDGFSHVTKFSSLADVSAFLAGSPQNNADTPYEIKLVNMDFSQLQSQYHSLFNLYETFGGKYVSVDLSEVTGEMLDPASSLGSAAISTQTQYLVHVTLPSTLIKIGKGAFNMPQTVGVNESYDSALRSVTLPADLQEIGHYAFVGCHDLVIDAWPANLKKIGDIAFRYCAAITGDLELPATVTLIGDFAFAQTGIRSADLSNLNQLTGNPNLSPYDTDNYLGDAFYNCADLEEVILPSVIKSIRGRTFEGCENLTTININDLTALEYIGGDAFKDTGITAITVNSSALKKTELDAFNHIPGLTTLDLSACTAIEYLDMSFFALPLLSSVALPNTNALTYVCLPYYTVTDAEGNLVAAPTNSLTTVTGGGGKLRVENSGKMVIFANTETEVKLIWARGATGAVSIPGDVTRIETGAFMGSGITSLTAAAGSALTAMGNFSFYGCPNLATVDLSACTILNNGLGTRGFAACTSLTTVNLPPNLSSTGTGVFHGDTALVSMEIPIGTELGYYNEFTFGQQTFQDCTALTGLTWNITADDPVIRMTNWNIFGGCTALTNVDFLPQDKKIYINLNNIFSGCTNLTAITLPALLQSTLAAYTGSLGPLAVTVPAALPAGKFTMTSFPAGSTFTFEPGGEYGVDGDFIKSGTTVLAYNGSATGVVTLPEGTTGIGPGAFAGKSLTSIDLSGVTYIGAGAFANCTSLAQVTLGAKLPTYNASNGRGIATDAFSGCTALSAVTIPADQGEAVIVDGTSYDYSLAVFLNIIKSATFQDSPVTFTVPGTGRLSAVSGGKALVYTKDADAALIVAVNGAHYAVPAGITNVVADVFTVPALLQTLDLGACNAITLDNNAVRNCENLAKVTLPATMGEKTLPGMASSTGYGFQEKASITQVIIPSTLEAGKVLSYHFRGTHAAFSIQGTGGNYQVSGGMLLSADGKSLIIGSNATGTVTIPAGIEVISDYAFLNSPATAVNFPASLKSIGPYAFQNAAIEAADLSATGITTILQYAFDNCLSLAQVRFPPTLETIYSYAFRNAAIRTLTLPASFKSFLPAQGISYAYNAAFQQCTQLEWVRWAAAPEGAQIGAETGGNQQYTYTFNGCTSLQKVELPANLRSMDGRGAFNNCPALATVILRGETPPTTTVTTNSNAFFGNVTEDKPLAIYVPDTSVNAYQAASGWSFYSARIVSVTRLPAAEDPALWQ